MAYTREQMIALAMKYKGAVRGSAKHKDLINTFNKVKPHGQKMTYTWAWCAATVTAWLIKGGYTTKNMPMSYSCKQLIKDTQALEKKGLGTWVENDAWKGAEKGDLLIYYWHAPKKGDCKKYTSHVGMIYDRTNSGYEVIEGNKNNKVGTRSVPFDWQYIRGFCHLKYDEKQPDKPIGKIVVDGVFGKVSIKRAQQYFGTPDDGIISGQKRANRKYYKGINADRIKYGNSGSMVILKIQHMVGAKSKNGILDENTVKALQHFLGIVEDGKWGKATSKAFQTWLNNQLK